MATFFQADTNEQNCDAKGDLRAAQANVGHMTHVQPDTWHRVAAERGPSRRLECAETLEILAKLNVVDSGGWGLRRPGFFSRGRCGPGGHRLSSPIPKVGAYDGIHNLSLW